MNAEEQALLRRAEDLCRRSASRWQLTGSSFLTPAERMLLEEQFHPDADCRMLFYGGYEDAERVVAFFVPVSEADEPLADKLCAVHYRAFFGEPGHRDYLGALLASGISRDRLGDILISGSDAWIFCLPGILNHLLTVDRIGRVSVKAEALSPEEVPVPEQKLKALRFTVQSLRLDAVCAGMFRLSRSACSRLIEEGLLSLNYHICTKCDATVREGDVLALRGHGKGSVTKIGGSSRKGRLFVDAQLRQ